MIENRELTMDDYLAILRRRFKVILLPALLAPLAGFLISFVMPPKYTSQSTVLVDEQKVPESYVKPVVTEDLAQRLATLQQQVLSRDRLRPMVERLGLAKRGKSIDDVIDDIQTQAGKDLIEPVEPGMTGKKLRNGQSDAPGFYVNFTADNPKDAQAACSELTSMLLEENLKAREAAAQATTDFLSRQLDEAKRNINDQDSKLASFKKQFLGQLPGDEENNMRILMGLNSQLDSNTQTLNRAQQDKAYTESLLAQQLAAWKSSQNTNNTNPETLEQQLSQLQSQLLTLQSRYTDDYPDVVKTKADIAEVKRKLDEVNAAAAQKTDTTNKDGLAEPPEIKQLRLQIHQYGESIAEATRDQKRLQDEIKNYQGRVALSPSVEEQYKQLTRDYDTAQKFYSDLLVKKNQSEMATAMEQGQQGEQMSLLNPAILPDSPSFPNRLLFAGGGLGGGLVIGLGLALWTEMRDKSIRTEQDAVAVLDLPLLVSVPWVGADRRQSDKESRLRKRPQPAVNAKKEKEAVEV
jgi:polysaccharide chain length determinant protein (PEP-CTERM system associated)